MQEPWEIKWEVEGPLGGGGQGATYLVRSKADPSQKGVLKTQVQDRKNDAKSRQRMHQEVSNLQIVSSTAAKVPKILDSNTHLYIGDGDLYFVMEYIEGESLEDLMKREKALSPDEAFELAIDLSKTLLACHEQSIMHRDLKPGNIIIRGRNPMDAVIVDYGLSFNEKDVDQNDLTSQGEPIGNSFTDLPERRTPGAQRHYESDLTAVMGILYYCITSHRPSPFRDATFGMPPHRRKQPGLSLREAMPNHPSISRLEVVFDRAFEWVISDRFSRAKELIERLRHAMETTATPEPRSLDDVLKIGSTQIISASRKVQLHKYGEVADRVIISLENEVRKSRPDSQFTLRLQRIPPNFQVTPPDGMSFIGKGFGLVVTVRGIDEHSVVEYLFAAQGNQTAMLRRRMKIVPPPQPQQRPTGQFGGGMGGGMGGMGGGGGMFGGGTIGIDQQTMYLMPSPKEAIQPAENLEVRLWYQADAEPSENDLMGEIAECVQMQIEELNGRLR